MNGIVTVNEAPTKSKLYRFCEKKIDKWAEGRFHRSPIDFTVSFTEEEDTRQISCETEIRFGDHVFRGADLGSDTQQAFIQSMKRLQPH